MQAQTILIGLAVASMASSQGHASSDDLTYYQVRWTRHEVVCDDEELNFEWVYHEVDFDPSSDSTDLPIVGGWDYYGGGVGPGDWSNVFATNLLSSSLSIRTDDLVGAHLAVSCQGTDASDQIDLWLGWPEEIEASSLGSLPGGSVVWIRVAGTPVEGELTQLEPNPRPSWWPGQEVVPAPAFGWTFGSAVSASGEVATAEATCGPYSNPAGVRSYVCWDQGGPVVVWLAIDPETLRPLGSPP